MSKVWSRPPPRRINPDLDQYDQGSFVAVLHVQCPQALRSERPEVLMLHSLRLLWLFFRDLLLPGGDLRCRRPYSLDLRERVVRLCEWWPFTAARPRILGCRFLSVVLMKAAMPATGSLVPKAASGGVAEARSASGVSARSRRRGSRHHHAGALDRTRRS